MSRSILETTTYLDTWAESLCSSDSVHPTIDELFAELNNIRLSVSTDEWRAFATTTFREHRLHGLLLEDPLSRRAFEKPRGYAGDAVTIDYIYAPEDVACLPDARRLSPLGRSLYFEWMVDIDACRAVRTRRAIVRHRLEQLGRTHEGSHVLSVACGHLREAARCDAVSGRAFGRFVALDQDPASLAVVKTEYGPLGVETVSARVGDVVRGKVALGEFDFIYASGLYDYVPTSAAQQLTSSLFAMLRPGGTLLFANVLPSVEARGYMEACTDWWMIYRSRSELAQIATSLGPDLVDCVRIFADPLEQWAYVEAQRQS